MPDAGNLPPVLDWYLVHARPRQEVLAVEHLERQGYAAYLPRLKLPKFRHRAWQDSIEPLFPRYLFAGVVPDEQSVHPIRSTRGVSSLVRAGEAYVPVPSSLIGSLRAREDGEGMHVLKSETLQPGDKLHVIAGPFAGLEAVFQSRQGTDRVRVLLTLIGNTTPATLPAGLVVAQRGVA